jgi:CheY-like chemotaxis protein
MSLPIYQHPSTVVLVDDNTSFLDSVRFQLGDLLPCQTFGDALAAIAWLRASSRAAAPAHFFEPGIDAFAAQPLNVALHVERVCRVVCDPLRFAAPSVLVVDYAMPGMNGIQVCEAVRQLPCRRILLTGAADERIAIDAFNRGLIDRYIRKSDPDALERLDSELAALQRRWFLDQADALRKLLPLHGYGFIDDPAIEALVAQTVATSRIVEHYLVHDPAGFLMLDRDGKCWLLVIETEQSMSAHLEVARDSGAPPSLQAALERRVVIPNFSEGDGMYSPAFGKDWYRWTAPARVCAGRQPYYWALFETRPGFLSAPLASYADYLRQAA